MCDTGWEIKVKNNPVLFTGKPKLTHSTAKGGTSFSFEVYGRPLAAWENTERARVEASFKNEQLFIGNIVSRSTDWDSRITTYNAVGYYTHTRREPITKRYFNPFQVVINKLLEDSKAKPFIPNIVYKIGNITDTDTSILNIFLDRQYVGQYLDACLDDICKAVGCQWFIQPETGFLVIWQIDKITQKREIDIEETRKSGCQEFKFNELKANFIKPEISRVVVAKDADSIRFANVPQSDSVNNYLILTGDPAQSTDLLKKTGIVKQYFITPNPVNCDFLELDPYSSSYDHTAQSGTFDVIVNDSCGWFAQTEQDWIDITLGVGEGNAPVEFDIEANPFTVSRSGSIDVSTSGASATHDIFQDGDPDGIPVGCDAIFFTLDSFETTDDVSDILLDSTETRPKVAYADAFVTPQLGTGGDATQDNWHEEYTLTVDLTDPSLSGISALKLNYSVFVQAQSVGDTSTLPAGPYPSPAYSATASFSVEGSTIETSTISDAGGDFDITTQTVNKTSSLGGPFFPVDLTGYIGSIITIAISVDSTLTPDAVKGYPPNTSPTAQFSIASVNLTLVCTT